MNFVLAFDSYKGSLSSKEINEIVSRSIKNIFPDAGIDAFLMADGGEGTLEALIEGMDGKIVTEKFTNLEFKQVDASLGFVKENCIIEAAQTVGITFSNRKNVGEKSTIGMGEQILYGLELGYKKFAICLGGSGTNDLSIGLLGKLGFKFYDKNGDEVEPLLKNLHLIKKIDDSKLDSRVRSAEFTILSDVGNPLFGESGATYIYGPQKGVTKDELPIFDEDVKKFASVAKEFFSFDRSKEKGAGAAGGLGYGLLQFLDAKAESGVEYVLDILNAKDRIKKADVVLTGEGKSDAQTANGKVPFGVAKLAKEYDKPVLLFSGAIDESAYELHDIGIDYITSIQSYPAALEDVIKKETAAKLLNKKVEESLRLLKLNITP
jgi:glycerate kinase